jgi:hypothetical protein
MINNLINNINSNMFKVIWSDRGSSISSWMGGGIGMELRDHNNTLAKKFLLFSPALLLLLTLLLTLLLLPSSNLALSLLFILVHSLAYLAPLALKASLRTTKNYSLREQLFG